ncbi:MAG: helix-turn-helix domain-containing protein [Candidatus Moranbacteria bacterium]|nr:helix-turn-helix domain-containing protein [Candidatus Moranbacteria bacterium]
MKQKVAMEILKAGKNVFLTGSAGTGKTYLLNKYIKYLKNRKITPVVLAPTGIAASHINGMTIHSFFGLGVREEVDDGFVNFLVQQKFLQTRLSRLKILIIDEVSMIPPELFRTIDKILRKFKGSSQPFGGVQLVLSGDFFQLPPISKSLKEEKFIWQTTLWGSADLKICYLNEKFRHDDSRLIKILDEIRSGCVSEESMEVFRSRYRKDFSNKFEITRLYTHNADVDRINEAELDRLEGDLMVFDSENEGTKRHRERIFKTSLVTPELKLKIGAAVIFVKNNYEKGYINGTLGKIVRFDRFSGSPVVEIFSGRKIIAEQEEWMVENDKGKIQATVKQVPLRLAWALTVHKSQGMTLDAAEIDLSKTFEVGQGYVALSRIKSIGGLRLMGLNDVALMVDRAVLQNDGKIKKESDLNWDEIKAFSDEEKEKMFFDFILLKGGTIDLDEIKDNKKELKKEAKNKFKKVKKETTIEITKKLLKKKKSLKEIMKERGLAENTVVDHLNKIRKLYPDFNFLHLKPKKKIIDSVTKAVEEIKKRKNEDDFMMNGEVRLKSVFDNLGEKVSYEDIKLALLFVD